MRAQRAAFEKASQRCLVEKRAVILTAEGKRFLADHYDSFDKRVIPSERTLCGHVDMSPRGMQGWQAPFAPAGAVQNKIATADMAGQMSFAAVGAFGTLVSGWLRRSLRGRSG